MCTSRSVRRRQKRSTSVPSKWPSMWPPLTTTLDDAEIAGVLDGNPRQNFGLCRRRASTLADMTIPVSKSVSPEIELSGSWATYGDLKLADNGVAAMSTIPTQWRKFDVIEQHIELRARRISL